MFDSLTKNLSIRLSSRKSKAFCPVPGCKWKIEDFDGNIPGERKIHLAEASNRRKDGRPTNLEAAHRDYRDVEKLLEDAIKEAEKKLTDWRRETYRQKLGELGLPVEGSSRPESE